MDSIQLIRSHLALCSRQNPDGIYYCICLGGNSVSRGLNMRRTAERSEEHTSELQSRLHLVCRLLLEKSRIHAGNRRGIEQCRAERAVLKQIHDPDVNGERAASYKNGRQEPGGARLAATRESAVLSCP